MFSSGVSFTLGALEEAMNKGGKDRLRAGQAADDKDSGETSVTSAVQSKCWKSGPRFRQHPQAQTLTAGAVQDPLEA